MDATLESMKNCQSLSPCGFTDLHRFKKSWQINRKLPHNNLHGCTRKDTIMAMSKTVKTETGIEIKDAYIQIIGARYTPPADLIVNIAMFVNEEQRKNGGSPFGVSTVYLDPNDIVGESTFLRGLYLALKKLPDYKNTQDC